MERKIQTAWFVWCALCGSLLPTAIATIPESVCGRAGQLLGDCFKNFTPTITVEALQAVKIPDSLEEINNRCVIFNRGMECVDRYLRKCVNARYRKIIENEVYGAQKLYEFLCYDQVFQREFLRHKQCFLQVHPEWDLCSNQFVVVLKDEIVRTNSLSMNVQYMHFCCARYAYENCVYNSARFICQPDSAVFLRRIAKLLSADKHFLNCDKIEHELCSGVESQLSPLTSSVHFPLLSLVMIIIFRFVLR
ncbi:uncharacterized protein LOC128720070 [Anopheles nili]|uniref:uncharacterized protein LOC128720070 n=1 Tax=Anopheles nili TaxID=185578 RepID=UPI00237C4C96|nr:uncharacterized protein LOC128720070 [Anopheles nili]